jgi:hypothetical protein
MTYGASRAPLFRGADAPRCAVAAVEELERSAKLGRCRKCARHCLLPERCQRRHDACIVIGSSRCDGGKGGRYLGAESGVLGRQALQLAIGTGAVLGDEHLALGRDERPHLGLDFASTPAQLSKVFLGELQRAVALDATDMSAAVSAAGSSSMVTIFGFRENMSPYQGGERAPICAQIRAQRRHPSRNIFAGQPADQGGDSTRVECIDVGDQAGVQQ